MTEGAPASDVAAADFARRFAEYWRAPTPQRLYAVLAKRVRLRSRLRR